MLLIYIFYRIGNRESEFGFITHVLLKDKNSILHRIVLADTVGAEDVHALRVFAEGTRVVVRGWGGAARTETCAEADYGAVDDQLKESED